MYVFIVGQSNLGPNLAKTRGRAYYFAFKAVLAQQYLFSGAEPGSQPCPVALPWQQRDSWALQPLLCRRLVLESDLFSILSFASDLLPDCKQVTQTFLKPFV